MSLFECLPLKTLEEVNEWTSDGIGNQIKQEVTSIKQRHHLDTGIPRTLVCHDMRGNYLNDRYVQGDTEMGYTFYHWELIDTFVYFSHYFVTIPPTTWINSAHKNGVKILGTFITEWDEGFAICDKFLSSESSWQDLADKLVKITTFYKFDGWLINIENKIQEEKVPNLCKFVEYLTVKLHIALPNSLVIWYDSVITTGQLKWQDQLNDKNSLFFDVCDGIFLNYNWNSEKLQSSKALAMTKNRPLDVYVGIDVFGRGCLGGGGFNTIEALTAVRQYNLSAAIFAQGWVYEKFEKDNFIDHENRFWDIIAELCPTSVWKTNCMVSSFCLGAGQKTFLDGKILSDSPWYNLSLQEVQPFYRRKQIISQQQNQAPQSLEPCFDCAYLGGGYFKYQGELPTDGTPRLFRLFDLNIKCCESFIIGFTYKTSGDVFVALEVAAEKDEKQKIFTLIDTAERENTTTELKQQECVILPPKTIEDVIGENIEHFCLPEGDSCWENRWYILDEKIIKEYTLSSIVFGISSKSKNVQTIHLGQVQVFPFSCIRVPTITNIQQTHVKDNITCLSWECSHPKDVNYYIIYKDSKFFGRSSTSNFLIQDLQTNKQVSPHFSIQAALKTGFVTKMCK